ncbi:MAG TPA: hypothetical protein PKJ13_01890 [bacterium]|nr:hypothetical protein [bacterium]HOY43633.1 hypothetical protein [bacterium]HPG81839.1 hypothetical protein [bacterium]HPM60340.1 hypothetical protein [bacterium]
MNREAEPILYYWLQSAQSMRVRRIRVVEGRERLQINLENAVFFRLLRSGRPDGMSARGCATYLHFYREEARKLRAQGESKGLSTAEQRNLEEELLSYFPRALAFLKLGEYKACAQDLHHCMELARFTFRHGKGGGAAESCMEMMPTLHMIYYLALCAMSLEAGHPTRALYYLDRGVQNISADYLCISQRSAGSDSEEALRLRSFREIILQESRRRLARRRGKSPLHVPICQLLSQQRRPAVES